MDSAPALSMRDVVFRYLEQGKRNILDHVGPGHPRRARDGADGRGRLRQKARWPRWPPGSTPKTAASWPAGRSAGSARTWPPWTPSSARARWVCCSRTPTCSSAWIRCAGEMRFCMENLCLDAAAMDPRIEAAAAELGVQALLDRPLHTLSGGEKQRAALACLYVMECRCLLLDECFANLGPGRRARTDGDAAPDAPAGAHHHRDRPPARAVAGYRRRGSSCSGRAAGWRPAGCTGATCRSTARCLRELGLFYPDPPAALCAQSGNGGGHPAFRGAVSIAQGEEKQKRGLFRRAAAPAPLLLDRAQAQFPKGAMTAVLGPSGCGKTTTFLAVLRRHAWAGAHHAGRAPTWRASAAGNSTGRWASSSRTRPTSSSPRT